MSNQLPPRKDSFIKKFSFHALTEKRWNDFEKLFGAKGTCGGCWCMYFRLSRAEYERNKGVGNKMKMKRLVHGNTVPGILMYVNNRVAGWCSVAPREGFSMLGRSRILQKVDEAPVWSVTCFYMDKEFRRSGLSSVFLQYIIQYCKKKGAKIVEGYPVDVNSKEYPVVFAHTGFYPAFKKAGFKEVARRSATRPVMRYTL